MIKVLVNTLTGIYSGYMLAKGYPVHPGWVLGTYGAMIFGETCLESCIDGSDKTLEKIVGYHLIANSSQIGFGYILGQCFGRMFD